MLTYFPTPYPDETFYSVLCRYYVLSGLRVSSIVKKQLFGSRDGIQMATLFPNGVIHQVVSRLPKGLFDERELIYATTPFLYYTRLYPLSAREAMLRDIMDGHAPKPAHIMRNIPKDGCAMFYCPCCVAEDARTFGEAYYHVEHQIPYATVCFRHQCRLKPIRPGSGLSLHCTFHPLGMEDVETEPDRDIRQSELAVSRLVYEYWKLPASIGPTEGYNNLHQALLNSGYLEISPSYGAIVDKVKLYDDLCAYHGEERVVQEFGKRITTSMINRMRRWEQLIPDRYLLLQSLLGLPTATVFSDTPLPDQLKGTIQRYADNAGFMTLKQAAAKLDMIPWQVCALVKQYGIAPFWRDALPGWRPAQKMGLLRYTVEADELERIMQYAKELG